MKSPLWWAERAWNLSSGLPSQIFTLSSIISKDTISEMVLRVTGTFASSAQFGTSSPQVNIFQPKSGFTLRVNPMTTLSWWHFGLHQRRFETCGVVAVTVSCETSTNPNGSIPLWLSRECSWHSSVTGEQMKTERGIDAISSGSLGEVEVHNDMADSGIDTCSFLAAYRFLSWFFLGFVSLCFLPIPINKNPHHPVGMAKRTQYIFDTHTCKAA